MKFKNINSKRLLFIVICALFFINLSAQQKTIYQHHRTVYDQVRQANVIQFWYDSSPEKNGWDSDGLKFVAFSKKEDSPGLIPVYQYITDDGRQLWDTQKPASGDKGWKIIFYAHSLPASLSSNVITKPIYQYGGSGSVIYTTNESVEQLAVPSGFRKAPKALFHAIVPLRGAPGLSILSEIPLIGQETNLWCWAACTQMVMEYYYTFVPQCEIVNKTKKRGDCCTDSEAKQDGLKCRQTGWFRYDNYGFDYDSTTFGTAVSWIKLKEEIDANRPVSFAWSWSSGGGHLMVATGYLESGDNKLVYVTDPWPAGKGDHRWVTYKQFVSQPKNHTHQSDLYNLRYKTK
ncbi:MAG: C39 family peptidase [Saprospiraceae bacterium]|nr:C39 family peptidase [Saprospiraceae bacterium]MCB9325396.1 C39 family peptidase [Lewinellaceae bacterium]